MPSPITPPALLRKYRAALVRLDTDTSKRKRAGDPRIDFFVEGVVRLEQLEYILRRFRRLELEAQRKFRALPK